MKGGEKLQIAQVLQGFATPPSSQVNATPQRTQGESNRFMQMMSQQIHANTNDQTLQQPQVMHGEANGQSVLETFGLPISEVNGANEQALSHLLSNWKSTNEEAPFPHDETDKLAEDIALLVAWLNGEIELEDLPNELLALTKDAALLMQIIEEIQAVIKLWNQPNQADAMRLHANNLYQLMSQWMNSDRQQNRHLQWEQFIQTLADQEVADVLKDVLSAYERRTKLLTQQMYQTDATITRDTVASWLEQALTRHLANDSLKASINSESETNLANNKQVAMPMSPIQQYTLHVSSLQRIEAISNELVHKMQQIINQSQFLKNPAMNELMIRLHPEQLGEMTIRFVQVNGEMTVKFLVSSQMTKQLLEANMHQLKHMFAPHQIIIERDTTVLSDTERLHEEQEEQQQQEEDLREQEQYEEENNEEFEAVDFEALLEMLRKEEVVI